MTADQCAAQDRIRTVRSFTDMDAASKLLLQELVDRTVNGTVPCTDSAAALGQHLGYSVRHIKGLVSGLAADGWLRVEHVGPSKNSPRRSIYLTPKLKPTPDRREHRFTEENGR